MQEVHGNFFRILKAYLEVAVSLNCCLNIQIFTQYNFSRPRSCSTTQFGHLPGSVYRARGHNLYPTWWSSLSPPDKRPSILTVHGNHRVSADWTAELALRKK